MDNYPFREIRIKEPILTQEDDCYKMTRRTLKFIAETAEQFDNFILETVIELLPKDVTELIIFNKQFIIEALREKIERENGKEI